MVFIEDITKNTNLSAYANGGPNTKGQERHQAINYQISSRYKQKDDK
jgi:hypothetical protein